MATPQRTNGTTVQSGGRRPTAFAVVPSTTFLSLSRWTVATVRQAIDLHEQGDFYSSSLLAEAVLRDGAIFSTLQTRAFALASRSSLPFHIDASEGVDDRRADSVANDVDDLWWVCVPESETAALMRDVIMLGVAVGIDEGQQIEGEWVPRVRRLRPHGLRWIESERAFHYIDGDGEDHLVTPGKNGWILHAPFGGDSWMFGAIRSIGIPWIGRINALRDFFRFSEKHGMPALAIEEPFSAADDVEGEGGAASASSVAFYADLKKLPQESLIRLPQPADKDTPGWKAEWLELKSRSYDAFETLVTLLRREVTSILLGRDPDSSASAVGGDGASLLERVRGEFLAADAEGLATTLREQVLKPWIVRNYDANRPELAPWPRWDTRPPVDLAARATTLLALGQALALLRAEGVDTDPVLKEFHLSRSGPPQAMTSAPAPAAAPEAKRENVRRFAAYRPPPLRKAA
jgi:phage gp29-like protein